MANAAILKLTTELAFIEKTLASLDDLRTGPVELFVDRVFENEINRYVRYENRTLKPEGPALKPNTSDSRPQTLHPKTLNPKP